MDPHEQQHDDITSRSERAARSREQVVDDIRKALLSNRLQLQGRDAGSDPYNSAREGRTRDAWSRRR